MRVNTRVVIDIASGRVLERESYEWHGPVALAFGGGSDGGSTTTTFAPPAYIQPQINQQLSDISSFFGSTTPTLNGQQPVGANLPNIDVAAIEAELNKINSQLSGSGLYSLPGSSGPTGDQDVADFQAQQDAANAALQQQKLSLENQLRTADTVYQQQQFLNSQPQPALFGSQPAGVDSATGQAQPGPLDQQRFGIPPFSAPVTTAPAPGNVPGLPGFVANPTVNYPAGGFLSDPASSVAPLSTDTLAAQEAMRRAAEANTGAQDYLSSIVAGQGAGYENILNNVSGDVLPLVQSAFGAHGRNRGGLAQEAAASGITNALTDAQLKASALLPQVSPSSYNPLLASGGISQGQIQSLLNAPYNLLSQQANLISPFLGVPSQTTTASAPQTNPLAAAAGGAATGYGVAGPYGAAIGGGLGLLGAL